MPIAISNPPFSIRDLKPISVKPDRDFKAEWIVFNKKNTSNIAKWPEENGTVPLSKQEEGKNGSGGPTSDSTKEEESTFNSCVSLKKNGSFKSELRQTPTQQGVLNQFEDDDKFWLTEPPRLFGMLQLAGIYFSLHQFPLRSLVDTELVSDDFCQKYDPLNTVYPDVKATVNGILQELKEEQRISYSLVSGPDDNTATNLALYSIRGAYGYRVFDFLGLSYLNAIVQIVFFTPIFKEFLEASKKNEDFKNHCSELIYTLLKIDKEIHYLRRSGNEGKRNPLKKLISELQEDVESCLKEEDGEIILKNSCAYWSFLLNHISQEVNDFNGKVRGRKIAKLDRSITTASWNHKDQIMGSPRFLGVSFDRHPDFKSDEISNIIALPHVPGTEKRFYRIIAIICKKGKTETYEAFTHDNFNGKWLNINESFVVEVNESLVLSNAETHGHMMFYEKTEEGPKTIHD